MALLFPPKLSLNDPDPLPFCGSITSEFSISSVGDERDRKQKDLMTDFLVHLEVTHAILGTFHWYKAVVWPQLTARRVGRNSHPVGQEKMGLRSRLLVSAAVFSCGSNPLLSRMDIPTLLSKKSAFTANNSNTGLAVMFSTLHPIQWP